MKRFTQRNHLHVATDDITLGAAWNPRFAFPLKGNAPRSVSAADIQRRSRQSNRPKKKKKKSSGSCLVIGFESPQVSFAPEWEPLAYGSFCLLKEYSR